MVSRGGERAAEARGDAAVTVRQENACSSTVTDVTDLAERLWTPAQGTEDRPTRGHLSVNAAAQEGTGVGTGTSLAPVFSIL